MTVSRDIAACFKARQPRTLKEMSIYCFSNPATSFTHNSFKRTFDLKSVHTVDNGLTGALTTQMSPDRGALLENLVFQELRRRGADACCMTQPGNEVDFLIREDRRVPQLIQVCASPDTPETIARENAALHRAAKAARCKELLLLTPEGAPPPERLIPSGPKVRVQALRQWLLEA